MKRWWLYTSERTQTRFGSRRVRRVLVRAAVAGALSLPIPSQAVDIVIIPRTSGVVLPRTGGAVIEAWAIGTLSEARRPNSDEDCDLNRVCELAITSPGGAGTGTGVTVQTFSQSAAQGTLPSNLPFSLSETIDYSHPAAWESATSGQGACHPATGVMAVADATSTLVLDIVGQACQMGSSNAQLVFTGSYVTDSASSGTFANADGIGTISINTPSGLHGTGTTMKASLEGQLKYGN
jgi:hypothetical protein